MEWIRQSLLLPRPRRAAFVSGRSHRSPAGPPTTSPHSPFAALSIRIFERPYLPVYSYGTAPFVPQTER
jgi:hypothetical protein